MSFQLQSIALVEEVEKYPILYNFRLPGYSKKAETEKAWGAVARKVHLSVPECKERWKNLRAVFVRNMKPSKNGARAKPKKAYYLQDAMQFAVPYIRTLGEHLEKTSDPLKQEDDEDEEENAQFEEYNYEYSASEEPEPVSTSRQSQPASTTKTKRSLEYDAERIEHVPSKKGKSSSPDLEHQDPKTEGLKMFLLSMLPDLLKMSDGQVRRFKRMTLDAVDDILSSRP